MSKVIEVYSKGERYEVVVDKEFVPPSTIKRSNNHFVVTIKKRNIYLHRYIMGEPKGMVVDHVNGNQADNRKSNLRICTQQQNTFNRKAKGYRKIENRDLKKPWVASIHHNKKHICLGYYETEAEARMAYKIGHVKLFGEYSPYAKEDLGNPPERKKLITSGKGYYFDKKRNKYVAVVTIQGKQKYLGSFDTPDEAQQVYRKAHAEAFGEFSSYYKYYSGITKEVN